LVGTGLLAPLAARLGSLRQRIAPQPLVHGVSPMEPFTGTGEWLVSPSRQGYSAEVPSTWVCGPGRRSRHQTVGPRGPSGTRFPPKQAGH
jgi:hypothetical protein